MYALQNDDTYQATFPIDVVTKTSEKIHFAFCRK